MGLTRIVIRRRDRLQQRQHFIMQRGTQLRGLRAVVPPRPGLQCLQQMAGGGNADISGQQHRFQFFVKSGIEFAPGAEQAAQTRAQLRPAFAQPLLQAGQPAGGGRGGVFILVETKHDGRGLNGAALDLRRTLQGRRNWLQF